MSAPATAMVLLGRERELQLVTSALDTARRGAGSVLLVEGDPGTGKTSLLSAARELASEFTTAGCRGVEWEAELPFSGLHELLATFLVDLPALPIPQRRALEGALGLGDGDESPRLHLHAAVLSLLGEATRRGPVLLVIDDLQWVDSATLEVLSFVARRIESEPLCLLLATRPGPGLHGHATAPVKLAPLNRTAVGELAARQVGRALPESAIGALTEASAGNPLAVMESVRHLGEALWLRGSQLDDPLPVGALIERGFEDQLATLEPGPRRALEVVAASVSGDAATIIAALEHDGLGAAELEAAEAAGVVEFRAGTVAFRHPLLRSLVHARSSPERWRACHLALSRTLDARSGLGAWHAASAATSADEAIAAPLEIAATRFLERGGHVAAAQAFVRAADLTPDGDARAQRLIRGSLAAHFAGRGTWSGALLADATAAAEDPLLRLRAEYQALCLEAHVTGSTDLPARHLALANAALGLEDDLVAEALASAGIEALLSGDRPVVVQAIERLDAFRATATLSEQNWHETQAALGVMIALTTGEQRGVELLRAVGERGLGLGPANQGFVLEALVWVEEFTLADRLAHHIVATARLEGGAVTLTASLWADGLRRMRLGDWDMADARLREALDVSASMEHVGQDAVVKGTLAVLEGSRGTFDPAQVEPIEALALRYGFAGVQEYLGAAMGMLELGAGRGPEAVAHLERAKAWKEAAGQIEVSVGTWPADLVDAHLIAGDLARAAEALAALRAYAEQTGRRWALAAVERLAGAMAPESEFEAHFEEALRRYEEAREPFGLARARLAYGQRLRRARRRVEARPHLEAALVEFERLGAAPWAEQARRELGASGATIRKGAAFDPAALTPQEQQVAELVVGGASNKEAAGAMFLSPKTIETHLSRIYRKLDVTSRTQLAAKFRAGAADG